MNLFKRITRKYRIFLINKVFVGTKHFKIKNKLINKLGFKVGKNTKVVGPFHCNATKLIIGDNCWIGRDFYIDGNGEVEIGDNCDIAPEVLLLTGSHKLGDKKRRAGEGILFKIKIENGCWICARSVITNNTTIGESSIIGSCSFVNKNVDKNSLSCGIPSKIIKNLE